MSDYMYTLYIQILRSTGLRGDQKYQEIYVQKIINQFTVLSSGTIIFDKFDIAIEQIWAPFEGIHHSFGNDPATKPPRHSETKERGATMDLDPAMAARCVVYKVVWKCLTCSQDDRGSRQGLFWHVYVMFTELSTKLAVENRSRPLKSSAKCCAVRACVRIGSDTSVVYGTKKMLSIQTYHPSKVHETCVLQLGGSLSPDFSWAFYAQTSPLVNLILVEPFSFLIITFQVGGVTTCKFVRIIPLFLPYLPIPTRTHNEGVRRQFVSPEAFKQK